MAAPGAKRAADGPLDGGSAAKVARESTGETSSLTAVPEDPTLLPKFQPVARLIRNDTTDVQGVTEEKLVQMFSSCGLKLKVAVSEIFKRTSVPRNHNGVTFLCNVTCGREMLGQGTGRKVATATTSALRVVWERFKGVPRFAAVATLIKGDVVGGNNAIDKANNAFGRCNRELRIRFKTERCQVERNSRKSTLFTHRCVIYCDAQVLARRSAATRKQAKLAAYEALWAWLAGYPDGDQKD